MTVPREVSRTPVVLAWSGGKDSALALDALQKDDRWNVVGLLTTAIEPAGVVSMHRVPLSLIRAQAAALNLPPSAAVIGENAANGEYEAAMRESLQPWREAGVRVVAFGDLFLEDIRLYRERQFATLGMQCVFPLWGRNTTDLARTFIQRGFRARTCCVDARRLPSAWCGREFDFGFLRDLPPDVDPCGENGEFHTFVTDAPWFNWPVQISTGGVVRRGDFWYCDMNRDADVDGVLRHTARAADRFPSGASYA